MRSPAAVSVQTCFSEWRSVFMYKKLMCGSLRKRALSVSVRARARACVCVCVCVYVCVCE